MKKLLLTAILVLLVGLSSAFAIEGSQIQDSNTLVASDDPPQKYDDGGVVFEEPTMTVDDSNDYDNGDVEVEKINNNTNVSKNIKVNQTNVTKPIKIETKVNTTKSSNTTTQSNRSENKTSNLTGIENAITRVSNNQTRLHLEEVLAKIEAKKAAQLANLTELKVEIDAKTNKTIVSGEGKAKFLGVFPVAKRYAYGIDNNGNVEKKAKFFDFLFKKQDPVD